MSATLAVGTVYSAVSCAETARSDVEADHVHHEVCRPRGVVSVNLAAAELHNDQVGNRDASQPVEIGAGLATYQIETRDNPMLAVEGAYLMGWAFLQLNNMTAANLALQKVANTPSSPSVRRGSSAKG